MNEAMQQHLRSLEKDYEDALATYRDHALDRQMALEAARSPFSPPSTMDRYKTESAKCDAAGLKLAIASQCLEAVKTAYTIAEGVTP